MADYGLDPSLLPYLQSGFAPQQVTANEYGILGGPAQSPAPVPPPPPAPYPQLPAWMQPRPDIKGEPTVPNYTPPSSNPNDRLNPRPYPNVNEPKKIGASGDTPGYAEVANGPPPDYGMHPSVVDAIQGGFAPTQAPPDVVAGTVATPTPKETAASNAAFDKKTAAQKAYDASPEGLASASEAQQRQSIDEQRKAQDDLTAAQVAANDKKVVAENDFKLKNDAAIAESAAAEKAHQETIAKLDQEYAQKARAAADYKVDTNRDVGLRGMIAIALSGIGDALDHRHGPNAAAQILDQMIDKRIDDQWKQKDVLGRQADQARADIDHHIRIFGDERTAREGMRASLRLQLADEVQRAADASANPEIKARSAQTAALLTQQAAAITGAEAARKTAAIRAAQEERDRQAQIGIARGHLAIAGKQLDQQTKNADREWELKLDDHAREWEALGNKENAAKAKETAENGVFDATTGSGVLTEQGQAKMDRADALEKAARDVDPAKAQQLREQARRTRMDAETNDTFTIANKEARELMTDKVSAGQKLINVVDRIKGALAADPSSVDRTVWAGLETDMESAKADWIELHKGKPSSREFDAIGPMFGDDPNSVIARLAGRGKMIAALDHLRTSAISDTTTDLKGKGYKGSWRPHGLEAQAADVLAGKTGIQAGEEAEHPLGDTPLSFTSNKDRAIQAENNSEITPSGLTKSDNTKVQSQIDRYKDATDADRAKILTQLTSYATSDRPGVSQGVIALMRQSPEIYKQVTSALTPDQRSVLKGADASSAEDIGQTPIGLLKQQAASGDVVSSQELLRRAHAGDTGARAAVTSLFGVKR